MENASKALIIAGAILISILLISVGIMVMNSINQPIEEAQGQGASQAAQIFNSRFTKYEGVQTYAQLKSLIEEVNSSNSANDRQVTMTSGGGAIVGSTALTITSKTTNNKTTYTTNATSAKRYKVEFTYGTTTSDSGYVTAIKVTAQS